jgi:hypothetical protein
MKLQKATLSAYLESHGLPGSGSKKTLCHRIIDEADRYTLHLMAIPSGTISIGIALEQDHEQKSKQQDGTITTSACTI